jgi:uroporphyrinogen decarboxylase
MGYGQPLTHPLAGVDMRAVREYPWPDPAAMDVSHIREDALVWQGRYAVLGGDWSPFWHDGIDLFGMEELFIRMFEQPETVDAVFRRCTDYYVEVSRRIFEADGRAIDIFFIGNDFGGQNGPLLSPELFRCFILPHLKRLIDLGHAYRKKVMLHCCGGVAPLIPLMIEAGLDGLHSVQSSCIGMELSKLKQQFGRRILFNGGIDSHHVLIKGTPDAVQENTREVLSIMMPGGGYVAGASHDSILEETPVENILAMFDAIAEYGVYRK